MILLGVTTLAESLPTDLAAAHAMILAERQARTVAEAAVATARNERIVLDLELERLRFQLAKARRQPSEPGGRSGQFELALEDVEETLAAMQAAEEAATPLAASMRHKPARRPLPAHLPRVRQVYPNPLASPCCGGRLHKLGEDITESLERVPASWYVVQHVREKLSCRSCDAITQPPASSHPIAGGGPARCCWRRSPLTSSACTCRCTARAAPLRAMTSRSTSRRWRTGWAPSASR